MNQEFVEFFSVPTLSTTVSSIAYKYNYLREDFLILSDLGFLLTKWVGYFLRD